MKDKTKAKPLSERQKANRVVRITTAERDAMLDAARQGEAPEQPSVAQNTRLTEKQETFSQAVARGESFANAYREAYDCEGMAESTIHREAHVLTTSRKISARIAQIITEKERENSVIAATRAARVTQVLETLLTTGKTDTAKLRAAELLGRSVGLFVDRKEVTDKTPETLEELEAKLAKIMGK